MKRTLWGRRALKCKPCVVATTGTGLQTTPSHASPYDVSNHLIGRSVEVLDAFCLGRKPNLPNTAADPSTRPRPLLIKCANAWDRRLLLASRRKLKDFTKFKLFLREDLSPDERRSKRSPGNDGTVNNTHPITLTSQAPPSDTTHPSAIHGADSAPVLLVHS